MILRYSRSLKIVFGVLPKDIQTIIALLSIWGPSPVSRVCRGNCRFLMPMTGYFAAVNLDSWTVGFVASCGVDGRKLEHERLDPDLLDTVEQSLFFFRSFLRGVSFGTGFWGLGWGVVFPLQCTQDMPRSCYAIHVLGCLRQRLYKAR